MTTSEKPHICDGIVDLNERLIAAHDELAYYQRNDRRYRKAFDEIEAELGKLLGLTRAEQVIEGIIKRARSGEGAMSGDSE